MPVACYSGNWSYFCAVTNKQPPTTMSKQNNSDDRFNERNERKSELAYEMAALLGTPEPPAPAPVPATDPLLMAAMRGHGWGDPLHLEAHPNCTMCRGIRIAVGERTLERVLDLAKANSDHILELLEECSTPEEGWQEIERLLGIAEGDPYCAERRNAGEYEGIDLDIFDACSNA